MAKGKKLKGRELTGADLDGLDLDQLKEMVALLCNKVDELSETVAKIDTNKTDDYVRWSPPVVTPTPGKWITGGLHDTTFDWRSSDE